MKQNTNYKCDNAISGACVYLGGGGGGGGGGGIYTRICVYNVSVESTRLYLWDTVLIYDLQDGRDISKIKTPHCSVKLGVDL